MELFGADGEAMPGLNAEKVEDNGLFPNVDDPAEETDGDDDNETVDI